MGPGTIEQVPAVRLGEPLAADETALSRNDQCYRWLAAWLRGLSPLRRPETTLECVRAIADYATYHHAGRFADGAVENAAFEIGSRLDSLRPPERGWEAEG